MDFKLYAIRIFVTEWEEAIRFYTEQLGIPALFRDDEMGWVELDTGQAHLALERADPEDEAAMGLVGRFLGVSLEVKDIDAAYDELSSRGVEFISPPEQQMWGGMLAHFSDPNGNVLTLLGPIPEEE